MNLTNTRNIAASRVDVWSALNDPAVLKKCIPGCESLERETEHNWRAIVATRIGPVAVRFNARITLAEVDAPSGYTLIFEGQGGPAGFAKGNAKVSLVSKSTQDTELSYVADAQIGGKLAQVGSRLIDGVAAKLTEEFFGRFTAALAPEANVSDAEPIKVIEQAATSASVDATPFRSNFIVVGVVGVLVAILVLAYVLSHR